MRGLFSLVLLIAMVTLFITPHHNKVDAEAMDSNVNNNSSTRDHRCIGLHCQVAIEDETDVFMDEIGSSRMLAIAIKQVTGNTVHPGESAPPCPPNNLKGQASCTNAPQLNKGRPCEPKNRVQYPYCKTP
jgi:hypothetical protein